MADLRVALIGYGLAGRSFHAPLIAATDGLALSTVVTSDTGRAQQVGREHPGTQVLSAADQLWERAGQHDLAVIATPNAAHAPLATAAIDHGLAAVVDKPLALCAAEAQALVAHAQRRSVLLTVFQNRRWDADQLTLARLLAERRLGEVMRYESRFERFRPAPRPGAWRETTPPEGGGGVLLDLGSHLVDEALVHFGVATHVYAELDARRATPADDDAFIALRHAGGVISHLRASSVTAAPGPRLRVLGTGAAFVAPDADGQEQMLRDGQRPDSAPAWGALPETSWGYLRGEEGSQPVPSERGDWPCFYRLLAHALREGGPPPVDPRDAVTALGVLDAARLSAAESRVISLGG